eukprot:TRINITY_DN18648_c0_g1_i1.p1 TRINITY_DN18648_c0_g1~~TRINITY_DN18648_c0_g1_i1.p1  ORF type:complete len:205 (-),score=32.97 TRINITY_DN18648_c0_g1_i1:4-618(-)
MAGDCVATAKGRVLRARCCVIYSSIAAALLYLRYGEKTDQLPTPLNFETLDHLLKIWAIQNEEKSGIYTTDITIQGIQGRLVRCEFSSVHTYLLFSSPSLESDILIDGTFHQFLVFPEFLDVPDQRIARLGEQLQGVPKYFVGRLEEFHALYSKERLWGYTEAFLGAKADLGEFEKVYQFFLVLYSKNARSMCGKPTQNTKSEL